YDARVICDDKETSDYFERLISATSNYKAAANWLLGPIKSYLNDHAINIREFPVVPDRLAALIALVDEGKVNFSIAASRIFPEMIRDLSASSEAIANTLNLIQNSDGDEVAGWVREALAKMPDKVLEYKKGKKGLLGLFVGEVKRISKGRADLKLTNQLLLEKLEDELT
ncbi:MAG TPA: hypothetical protein VK543_11645, partial [Puia sp.]|nr:hypothetical protein [Puia sp.]